MMKQSASRRSRSVVVSLGPWHSEPWWWNHIDRDRLACDLDYVRLDYRGKRSQDISTYELPLVGLKIVSWMIRHSRDYDYLFTFECDLVGWVVSAWQTVFRGRRPRHVILQFIMRERKPGVSSALKYGLMKVVFSSVYKFVCSSRREIDYYREAFGWGGDKFAFVPFHTDPMFISHAVPAKGAYFLAAGRTFRDYATLVNAMTGRSEKLVLVAGAGAAKRYGGRDNIDIREDIPLAELTRLMKDCKGVIVPLENRRISIGQSIILQAMAMRKPVIATRTAGTEDYIQHQINGLLVDPGDTQGMARMMELLNDEEIYGRISDAGYRSVIEAHLPIHYAEKVRVAVSGSGKVTSAQ